ncbi:MAG: sulfatase-like hydrolase/transferase [Desulfomicrobium escambiense]|nr:sulfatase-like hydrolase/transferase [Desulfomicrobium escambiense]
MLLLVGFIFAAGSVYAQSNKPNILVIWGDDIGVWNLSCYHRGMMGGRTPNIDRIAAEGALFTDCYGQQSCTAGRAAFITGQHPFRTGLLKVGLPGAELGLRPEDPTIADLLKNHGYVTGQFGKNHLGDRNEYLPTVHGFDEFFGNLYHLNAEEEPEDPQYPKDPRFKQRFGPRGALRCKAADRDDPTVDPRFGKVGKQTIEDTGPITRKRMETVDEEFLAASLDFMERAVKAGKPFFIWHNTTRMHVWTRLEPEVRGQHGLRPVRRRHEAARRHRRRAAQPSSTNSASPTTRSSCSRPTTAPRSSPGRTAATTPFHGEKGGTWEGGFRVPCVVRWPGVVKPGTVINGIFSHEDWAVTLLAAAGEPDVKEKLKKGHVANGKTFKVHLDGYDQRELLARQGAGPAPGDLLLRRQRQPQRRARARLEGASSRSRATGCTAARRCRSAFPRIVNLRMDPFEAHVDFAESPMAMRWMARQDVGLRADAGAGRPRSCSRSRSSRSGRSRPASTSTR